MYKRQLFDRENSLFAKDIATFGKSVLADNGEHFTNQKVDVFVSSSFIPVSYTHLDVYKRQGQFDNQHDWHIAAQMGVANYGQMTAGGWMYIGPQGIVPVSYTHLRTIDWCS